MEKRNYVIIQTQGKNYLLLNIMSLHDVCNHSALHRHPFFIINELQWFLCKVSRGISFGFLHFYEFRIILLQE